MQPQKVKFKSVQINMKHVSYNQEIPQSQSFEKIEEHYYFVLQFSSDFKKLKRKV